MGVVKNLMMEMEEYDEPYDFDSYADFCDSHMVETSTKILEEAIAEKEEAVLKHQKACNNRNGYPDSFTEQDIDIELMELRTNPPLFLPQDEAKIIPDWYTCLRKQTNLFKEDKILRFVIPARYFIDGELLQESLPEIDGLYLVWSGDYDYPTAEEQVLWCIGTCSNLSLEWSQHSQANRVAGEAQDLELYKVYLDFIPSSSLALSLKACESLFLEELQSLLMSKR